MIREVIAIVRADLTAEGGIREAIESTKAAIHCCTIFIALVPLLVGLFGR